MELCIRTVVQYIYQGLNSTFLSSVPRKFLKILTDIVCVERNPWTHYFVVSSLWEKQDTPYNCQGFLHFPYFIDILFSFFFFFSSSWSAKKEG